MSTLVAMAIAVSAAGPPSPVSARLDGLALVPFEGRVAVRIDFIGRPRSASVTRSGNVARLTLARTDLGWRFGAGRQFEWRPEAAPLASFAKANRSLERLSVEGGRGDTSVVFELPPDVSVELRRVRNGLLVVLREAGAFVAQAQPPPTRPSPASEPHPATPSLAVEPPPAPPITVTEPTPAPAMAELPASATTELPTAAPMGAAETAPPSALPLAAAPALEARVAAESAEAAPSAAPVVAEPSTAAPSDLYRLLFPPATATAAAGDDTEQLYARLFPGGTVEQGPSAEDLAGATAASEPLDGFRAGPFRLKPYVMLSFVNADASLLNTPAPVEDSYFQFEPGVVAHAPVGRGAFTGEYAPAFRAGADFSATQDASHVLSGTLDFPFGADSQLTLSDRYVASTLDTREVDPGGEYFFDLAPFQRNLFSANARLSVGPRLFVELGGAFSHANFDRPGGFFGYDRRLVSAGLGYELTPSLRATVSYVYDEVPTPEKRPEAEASASSALLALQGDLLPLLTGRLALGYRDQESPNAALSGRSFRGFTMSGSLTREFGRESTLSILLDRSTPVSSFEANGFYVTTSVTAALAAPVLAELSLETGLGFAWNDYKVDALELGVPREDRLLSLYAGLRRSLGRHWWVSAYYRRERRQSNLDSFEVTSDGFLAQVSWGLFGPRR